MLSLNQLMFSMAWLMSVETCDYLVMQIPVLGAIAVGVVPSFLDLMYASTSSLSVLYVPVWNALPGSVDVQHGLVHVCGDL